MAVNRQKINEAEFLRLHASGHTDKQMAEFFQVGRGAVQDFRKRRGLQYNGLGKSWERETAKTPPIIKPTMNRANRLALLKEINERVKKGRRVL